MNIVPDLATDFKKTMRRLTSTVTVVSNSISGRAAGMTATAVTSLSMEPPAILVCVNRAASIHTSLVLTSRFCVNILGAPHTELAIAFGGRSAPENRFDIGVWDNDPHKVPYLKDATAAIFCIVDRIIDYETHSIFVGKVYAATTHPEALPLLYGDGRFHAVAGPA